MRELSLNFDSSSIFTKNEEINIEASIKDDGDLLYRFLIGKNKVWTSITEFQATNSCRWSPNDVGKYMVMVQAKEIDSKKPYDYLAREVITVKDIEGTEDKLLINDIVIDKTNYIIGEKINIDVKTSSYPVLMRLWRKGSSGWEPLRDYDLDSSFSYVAVNEGREEILVECKRPDSQEIIDDYKTVLVHIEKRKDIEITNIKCLNENIVKNEDLVFEVTTNCDNKRSILYKFLFIDKEDNIKCVQDYSSHNVISFSVKEEGEYKLLCLTRDMFSNSNYDDRAIINFAVKPYKDITINKFYPDLTSPQLTNTMINLVAQVTGGSELVYRYIIDGKNTYDTGYIRNSTYVWEPEKSGEYNITLMVKDISSNEEYEDSANFNFMIEEKGENPPKIIDVITTPSKHSVINEPINIKVIAEGGGSIKYSFIVFKDGVQKEKIEYGDSNWVNFIPEEKGIYEIEIRIKDKYSKDEYDFNTYRVFDIKEYVPSKIDHIIKTNKQYYVVGDSIDIEVVCSNTNNVIIKYITKINGHEVENTGFIASKKLVVKPKCAGKYTIDTYVKTYNSDEEYNDKESINIYVTEAIPVNSTEITYDKKTIVANSEVTFTVKSKGGKDVCYEFYIMEKGRWIKMQSYSRKAYYTFLPFTEGKYRILVLSKSYYKKVNYEDYSTMEFIVERD